jgi:predicted metal-dependent hydrolase
MEPDPATALARGIAEFNAGRFFQAHEIWEEGWHPSPEPERDFWQGLIQVAVGLTHRQRGNATGAVTLLRRGARKLRRYPDGHEGVPVAAVATFAERAADRIEAHGAGVPLDVYRIERSPA